MKGIIISIYLICLMSVEGFVSVNTRYVNDIRTSKPRCYEIIPKNQNINKKEFVRDHIVQFPSTLQMTASPLGLAALTGVISGGFFSGGLHAIAGPDHLAALLPRCCGQRWFRAGPIGALWGMGHGITATLLGVAAFALKNRLSNVPKLPSLLGGASQFLEIAVGVSLVFIGLMGIREAREWAGEISEIQPQSLSAAAVEVGPKSTKKRAVILNGLLHGLSWDGAPSLAPALAVTTWRGNISFLLAYACGTAATMALTTTLVGEGTRKAGEALNRPDIPQKISLVSSWVAILIGVLWVGFAVC